MSQHTEYVFVSQICDEELEVEFTYHSASKGSRDSFGCPLEPDEPESFEIDSVICLGYDITEYLNSDDYAIIEEAIGAQYE